MWRERKREREREGEREGEREREGKVREVTEIDIRFDLPLSVALNRNKFITPPANSVSTGLHAEIRDKSYTRARTRWWRITVLSRKRRPGLRIKSGRREKD